VCVMTVKMRLLIFSKVKMSKTIAWGQWHGRQAPGNAHQLKMRSYQGLWYEPLELSPLE
jgi:hypothetical protein